MNRTARTAALALVALGCAGCGTAAASGPDEAGLRAHLAKGIQAWEDQNAPALAVMTKNDECPLSVSDAVMGMAMAKGFGMDPGKMDIKIQSVKVAGSNGTVVTEAFGETEETTYTWRNGAWGEDNKNDDGTCDK